jgi:hypothetical protein
VGEPSGDDTQQLLRVVYTGYRPGRVIAVGMPDDDGAATVPYSRDEGNWDSAPRLASGGDSPARLGAEEVVGASHSSCLILSV